jgi:predicted nucleic acid-binding protein
MLVVDASVVVAALVDSGSDGTWGEGVLGSDHLAAPHLMPIEVANILRRAYLAGEISSDAASMAHGDLLSLQVDLFPYALIAERVWSLGSDLTAYDASYVALAELLGAPLATLDVRLTRAPGPTCDFLVPDL